MDKNLVGREVKIGDKEGEITNILGVGYEISFFDVNEGKIYIDPKEIEKYLVSSELPEHPVWKVLKKEKYVKEFYPQAEEMYDFIKSIVSTCGNVAKNGNTIPAMRVFFDIWNEYSSETFGILESLVYNKERE